MAKKKTTKSPCENKENDPMVQRFGEAIYIQNSMLGTTDPNKLAEKASKLACDIGSQKSKDKANINKACLCGVEKGYNKDLDLKKSLSKMK